MDRPVALARAHLGHPPEKRRLRLARRHRVIGKPIAEIRHRVLQAIGQLAGARHRLRQIAEERRHVGGRFEIALRVRREAPARLREIGVVMDAGEDVEERPLGRRREPHAAGGDDRHVERRREIDERAVVGFLVAAEVALQLDERLLAAEDAHDAIEEAADAVAPRVERHAADERDEPAGEPVELLERQRAFAFRRAQLHARDELAEIAIAVRRFRQSTGRTEGGRGGGAGLLASGLPYPPAPPIVSVAPMMARRPAAFAAL